MGCCVDNIYMRLSVETLNFHHLRYFWCVVEEGGVLPASRRLRVSHPTVSAQLRELEGQFGAKLFERRGRNLELTPFGARVHGHAEKIFGLGRLMMEELLTGGDRPRLRLGVTDDLPKLFVRQLLEPALLASDGPRLSIDEERHRTLLGRLATRELDVVFSDAPTPPSFRLEADDHVLGQSGLSFLAAPKLRASLKGPFPHCLEGAPFLAPLGESRLGQSLARWMTDIGLTVDTVAEVADSALLKTLGGDGFGVFVVPRVSEDPALAVYGVETLGRAEDLTLEYFATTARRASANPLIAQILDTARERLAAC